MQSVFLFVSALVVLLAAPHATGAFTITLNPGYISEIRASAREGLGSILFDHEYPTSLPGVGSASSSAGANTGTTLYDLSNSQFEFEFAHTRTATSGSFAGDNGDIYFSPDADVIYGLDGSYTVSDADGRQAYWRAYLLHVGVGFLFDNTQQSLATPHESFALGQSGGDDYNVLLGSLSGTLLAGQVYRFGFGHSLHNTPSPTGVAATGTGDLTLVLTAIPEPTTCLLLGLGLAGLAGLGFPHRQRKGWPVPTR